MRSRRANRGVTLVEFAIVAPLFLLVVFGVIDFGRGVSAYTTVADAARQATRQAVPNAVSSDNPFGSTYIGPCTGQQQTYQVPVNTSGCLTDTAIVATVKTVMSGVTSTVVQDPSNNCTTPPLNTAYVCIYPSQKCSTSCQPTAFSNCTGARTSLGTGLPTPNGNPLGDRSTEWAGKSFDGCFLVSVKVAYTFQPLTPPIAVFLGQKVVFTSVTDIVAEY
jgi:Flp pilus assembly protein TadG